MSKTKPVKKLLALSVFMLSATVYAANTNFNCPAPSEIQSTDFTAPSIWIAPPMAHAVPNMVGVGLGGKEVLEFLGTEPTMINHRAGWVCVYKSKGGLSMLDYHNKIMQILESNHYLKKYIPKFNRELQRTAPYVSKYSKDTIIGFVGYQAE